MRRSAPGGSRTVVAVIATRWVVLREQPVGPADRTADGAIEPAAVRRWIDAACAAYLDRCPALHRAAADTGLELARRISRLPDAGLLGRPDSVAVSASAAEFRPASVSLSVRM